MRDDNKKRMNDMYMRDCLMAWFDVALLWAAVIFVLIAILGIVKDDNIRSVLYVASFLLMLFNTALELTEVFFDLRREWTPAPKQRLQCISDINEAFSILLCEFYLEDTTTERRWGLLGEMTDLVFAI